MVLVLRTYVRILSDHFTSRSSCIVPCDRWFPGCLCTYVRTSGSGDHGKYASMPQRVLTYVRMYARSLHVRTYVHTFNERKGITCSYVRTSAPTLMRHRITRTCVRTYVRTYVIMHVLIVATNCPCMLANMCVRTYVPLSHYDARG